MAVFFKDERRGTVWTGRDKVRKAKAQRYSQKGAGRATKSMLEAKGRLRKL